MVTGIVEWLAKLLHNDYKKQMTEYYNQMCLQYNLSTFGDYGGGVYKYKGKDLQIKDIMENTFTLLGLEEQLLADWEDLNDDARDYWYDRAKLIIASVRINYDLDLEKLSALESEKIDQLNDMVDYDLFD